MELNKIKAAVEAGTDSIMDLSVSGDIDAMRKPCGSNHPDSETRVQRSPLPQTWPGGTNRPGNEICTWPRPG